MNTEEFGIPLPRAPRARMPPRRCSWSSSRSTSLNHQAGWTVPVITTATNKGVLLAIVAMAQTLPVLTAGIDLSVGMVFVLANCLASHLVVGTPLAGGTGHRRGARRRRAVRAGSTG